MTGTQWALHSACPVLPDAFRGPLQGGYAFCTQGLRTGLTGPAPHSQLSANHKCVTSLCDISFL